MIRLPRLETACIGLALILAACGGGSHGDDHRPAASYSDIGIAPHPVAAPTPHGSHGRATVSFDRTSGGHDARSVVEYLHAIAGAEGPAHEPEDKIPTTLATFPTPPSVHIASNTPPQYREIVAQAVANINLWLPYDKRIHFSADVPPLTPLTDVPQGQIFVDFADPAHWRAEGSRWAGLAQRRYIHTATGRQTHSARIWIEPRTGPSLLTTTTHELLHALAVSGHISRQHFPETIMGPRSGGSQNVPAIDGEALLAAYTRFDPGTHPDDISLETLGPWATQTMHLRGDIAAADNAVSFGVSFRNGLGHPWARGVRPETHISANPALSGSAEWNGTLLGFTPAGRTAAGTARISLDLTRMTGTANFNDIETWSDTPGAKGTGSPWGDLAYRITANGNSFRNSGGDTGELNGKFVGERHHGAVGTLDRADLTAAFGATR